MSKVKGWDIRLQCTVCGDRKPRSRSDGNPPFGNEPPATVMETCYNCQDVKTGDDCKTLHFVDYSTEEEDADYAKRLV